MDDAGLYFPTNTAHSVTKILQQAFDKLQDARINLKLVLNTNKSEYMLFFRARYIVYSSLHIATLNGQSIERVSGNKYLGI